MIYPFHELQTYTCRKPLRFIICILYTVAGINYIAWRPNVFNPEATIFSYLFYSAELFGFVLSFSIIFIGWSLKLRKPVLPRPDLSVDVFITVYNEPIDVIRRTIIGAHRIDYPHETWVLDDGNREELKILAEEFGCHYLARTQNINAKAGNLNNGLKYAKGDFVAIFDADHVAETGFLHKTLAYFDDPLVSFVQTPQDYYNTDAFQFGRHKNSNLIWHDQSWFNYIGQTGRDHWNAATLCGSSAVIRRSMLEEIGRFPVETVTEDMHCAVRLQKRGYKTVYHPEPLAYGIAPVDLDGYLKQRLRWGEGNLQVCREENLPFTNSLTIQQRLSYFFLTTNYLAAWQKLFYYITPIYVLFTQVSPILTDPFVFFIYFVPYMIMGILIVEEMGRGYGRYLATDLYAMAQVAIGIGATFGLIRKKIKFRVTSKLLKGKLPVILLLPHITIFSISMLAIIYTITRYLGEIDVAMPFGVALLLMLFAAINSFLALLVIFNAYRSSKLSEENYIFKIPFPATIYIAGNEKIHVLIEEISSSQFTFYTNNNMHINSSETINGEIYLPNKKIPICGKVRSVETKEKNSNKTDIVKYYCDFKWKDMSTSDELNMTLTSCKWHRLILNKHEIVMTPFDYLFANILTKYSKSEGVDERIPILFKVLNKNPEDYELGYISGNGHSRKQMFVFKPLSEGDSIEGKYYVNGEQQTITYKVNAKNIFNIVNELDFKGLYIESHQLY